VVRALNLAVKRLEERNFVWENAERERTLRKSGSGKRVSERNGKV